MNFYAGTVKLIYKTMEMWSYTVLVFTCIHYVLCNDMCSNLYDIKNCNDCMRCGATWCNNPNGPFHCKESSDDWCIKDRETLPTLKEEFTPGAILSYTKVFTTAYVLQENPVTLRYKHSSATPNVHFKVMNSTIKNLDQNHYYIAHNPTPCGTGELCTEIKFRPLPAFCPTEGAGVETVTLQVQVDDIDESAVLTYNVPCECECSRKVNTSITCGDHGKYSCGVCVCDEGWTGSECEARTGSCDRGDVEMGCMDLVTEKVCAGHGECGCDRHCKCYERPDVKYFDEMCLDICTSIEYNCDNCFRDPKEGHCNECDKFNLFFESNSTNAHDESWMKCNITILQKDCVVQYQVKKSEYMEYKVMVTDNCLPTAAAVVVYNVQIPAILGIIIALLATVAGLVAYAVWKHRNPPISAVDSGYGHIDPESSTGLNPLYKSPKSSFKNPMYGQNC